VTASLAVMYVLGESGIVAPSLSRSEAEAGQGHLE
jgi:hypothetical protein